MSVFDPLKCWVCHCTDLDGCENGCWWVEDPTARGDLCSRCVEHAIAFGQIELVLTAAAAPLSADELADRTGISGLANGSTATVLLQELVDGGHLDVNLAQIPPLYTITTTEEG